MSLLFNTLSRLVITFLPRNKRFLISWLQSPSTVILDVFNFNQKFFVRLSCDSYNTDINFKNLIKNEEFFCVIVFQLLSCVWLFKTPWTAAHLASLCFTTSQCLLIFMSIELVMLSNHLILCHTLLFLPSIFPSIRIFSSESALLIKWPKYWSFSFNISPST